MSKRESYEAKAEALLAPIVSGFGFELVDVEYVKEGSMVKRGDLLLEFDVEKIEAEGYAVISLIIICNSDDYSNVENTIDEIIELVNCNVQEFHRPTDYKLRSEIVKFIEDNNLDLLFTINIYYSSSSSEESSSEG